MASSRETAALILLLRTARLPWRWYADMVEKAGSAVAVLEQEQDVGDRTDDEQSFGQQSLFTAPPNAVDRSAQLDAVAAEIAGWEAAGIELVTVLDRGYPENLRGVHDRPPLVFVAGRLEPGDARSAAVVGTRRPSPAGVHAAIAIAEQLVEANYTVVSGLAAGIDTAVHTAALDSHGRTVAVIGTGLSRCYPPQNARLQHRIASECAVVSQFWPDAGPSRRSFPMRNAVISGLTLVTVVVEASPSSGSLIQARVALGQGRPVLLPDALLGQRWATELAAHPGAHVVRSPGEVTTTIERLTSSGTLTV